MNLTSKICPLCGVHVLVTFTLQRLDHEAECSQTGWMNELCSAMEQQLVQVVVMPVTTVMDPAAPE